MATIELYANKINQMPGLIKEAEQSVVDYKSELAALQKKALSIRSDICNMDDVISSIRASTQIQERKIASLDALDKKCEDFISNVVRIDNAVADLINQRKNEFLARYSYLKPDIDKSGWDKLCDGLKKVGDWCKEHWKLISTILIVIAAVIIIVAFPAAAPLLLLMAKGTIIGAAIGGVTGGTVSALTGGSFFEGFENGAFMGTVAGAIGGGMTFGFTGGLSGASLTLGQAMLIGAVSGGGSSILGDLVDNLFRGNNISWGQMLTNAAFSVAFGAAFAGAFHGISQGFSALKLKFGSSNPNKGPVGFTTPKDNVTRETITQTKAYVKGCNAALKDGALSPDGRVPTKGLLSFQASKAAGKEKSVAAAAGNPYKGNVGHVPDTTWTANPQPHSWLDLNPSVNKSLGRQALNYPIGYQPVKFVFNSPVFNIVKYPPLWGASFGSVLRDSSKE